MNHMEMSSTMMEMSDMSSMSHMHSSSSSDDGSFCHGGGVVMRSGFQTEIVGQPCVKWLFADAVLDSEWKYAAGVIGAFALAFLSETVRFLRARALAEKFPFESVSKLSLTTKDAILALSYGLQMVLAYWLMLLTMLYDTGIFTFIILGLTAGFFTYSRIDNRRKALPDSNCSCEPAIEAEILDIKHEDRINISKSGNGVSDTNKSVPISRGANAPAVNGNTPCCGGAV